MLRLTTNLKQLSITTDQIVQNLTNYQTIRYLPRKPRKPRWMPTAKSKLFRVHPRIILPKEEEDELTRLYNNYRTQMKSITNFLTNKYSVKLTARSDTEQIEKAFAEDFIRCNAINDEWNNKIKEERDQRIAAELAKDIEFAKNRLELQLKKKELLLEKAEEIVRQEKEAAKNFITPENLDAAIEYAIKNPIDYNFAIDLQGNKIMGRETKVEEKEIIKQ